MDVSPSSGAKLAARVARQIEAEVIAAGWPVGQIFGSEAELMARFQVSRSVLREAIRLVEHHRVAVMRRGPAGGLVVQAPDALPSAQALVIYLAHAHTTIDDLISARLVLEPATVAMVARTVTDNGIERLRGALEREATPPDFPGLELLDVSDELHVLLGELSGNPVLALFIEVLTLLTRQYTEARTGGRAVSEQASEAARRTHRAIVEATASRDVTRAEQLLAAHLSALGMWLREDAQQNGHLRQPGGVAGGSRHNQLKLAEVVADRIQRNIAREMLAEGDLIGTEQELMNRYGISRAVLREAVRLLEYHSISEMRRGPSGGLYVTRPTPDASIEAITLYLEYQGIDAQSLRAVRNIIELGCIDSVVARRNVDGVARRLRAAVCARPATPDAILEELGFEFHADLGRLTGNPVLALFLQIVTAITARLFNPPTGAASAPERRAFATEIDLAHRGIAEAILIGDTAVAKRRMMLHLDSAPADWWQLT